MENPACGILEDRIYYDPKVVIGCGDDTNNLQLWDLQSDAIYMTEFECPNSRLGSKFKKLDDVTLALVNTKNRKIYSFGLETGFNEIFESKNSKHTGNSIVLPSGSVYCDIVN